MAQTKAALGLLQAVSLGSIRTFRQALGNARVIIIASLLLISGTFASAAILQMQLDRERALDQAASFEARRVSVLAAQVAASLDRYAAIARGFASDSLDAESAAALSEAGGTGMENVAVLDGRGRQISEMKNAPRGLLPLRTSELAEARVRPYIAPSADGRSLILILAAAGGRFVAAKLDGHELVAGAPDALIATPSGRLLSLGKSWHDVPGIAALALDDEKADTRILEFPQTARLISLTRLAGWPIVVGSSVEVGRALEAWYGSLPLYLFFIFGPALAGAGLAAVFVREFERRIRTAEAVRNLRSTRPDEARLLVRLADAERRAIHAERAKAEFMSHLSHELRTPLNAIIGFSEIIENGTLGPVGHVKYAEYARDIGCAGRQLHARIGEILDFADLDARRRKLASEAVDVSALARECLRDAHDRARARGVRLLASLPEGCMAFADAAAVTRIFTGLIANAVEFTAEGGEVRMGVRSDGDSVLTTVRDTGVGFSAEEKAKAGEAFRTFERPGRATGLGLGLTIATTLARRMGGNLRIEGRQGEGAAINLRLPATQPRQA